MPQLTIEQAFELAAQHHRSGRLQDAEQLCRQILARQPEHLGAILGLGVIALDVGRYDIAVDLIRRAIALRPDFPEAHSSLASALKGLGRLDEAIAACRQAIILRPGFAEAHFNLGVILTESGHTEQAISAFRQAIALKPTFAEAHCNLGCIRKDTGNLDEAITAFRQAVALNPDYAEAHNNLGNALREKGQLDDSIAACRQAILLRPGYAEAHNNLGNALRERGELDDAVASFRRAIALRPDYADAHNNLGAALRVLGKLDEAIAACRQAIALRPAYYQAMNNLGVALGEQGAVDEAIVSYQQALAWKPDFAPAHSNLGNAFQDKGLPDQAILAYRRAIDLKPDDPESHNNLGTALKNTGDIDQAIIAYRRALALNPNLPEVHSNLVFTIHLHPRYDAEAIAQEERRWNHQYAEPLRPSSGSGQGHPNDRDPDRRLRVGYVSPDFCEHVVGRNLLPLYLQHDRRQFEITCYSNVRKPDAMTSRFQGNADRWRDIVGLSDEQAAAQIREDRIDILVDLALHTAGNRLLVFARKPAPVQATFVGYPGSTGLNAIEYRLSDPYLDSPGMDESIYGEKTIRLPNSFWCYDPLDCRDIPVNLPPCLRLSSSLGLRAKGRPEGSASDRPALERVAVTFGCLNNFCKINDEVLVLWAQTLRQVEHSRLLLLADPGSHRQRTVDKLSEKGIDPERIEFVGRLSRREYLQLYHHVDVGLDSFPYNGHTTSLDSFWMGVPVVTLVGQMAVSRAGWCQLSNLGLAELAGHTPEQFVRIAVELARDLPRIRALRSTLRQRMEQSPLMDAPQFARDVEAAYRQMWRAWCESGSGGASRTPSK